MAFTAFQGPRTPTRFETTGKVLETNLLDAQKNGDTRVYPHQIEAVFGVKAKLVENRKANRKCPVLVVAPTGSGKSGIVTLLPYILQCRKVLILTPSRIISQQLGKSFGIFEQFDSFFEKIGICPSRDARRTFMEHGTIISKGTEIHNSVPNLVIVTAQTLLGDSLASLTKKSNDQLREGVVVNKVKDYFGRFDTLIVDEAHHYPAETWAKIEETFMTSNTKQLIFLAATPERKFKGKKINILDSQSVAFSIERAALEGKYIRPLRFKLEKKEVELYSHIKAILEDRKFVDPRFFESSQHRTPQAMILVTNRSEADNLAINLNASEGSPNFAVSIHNNVANFKKKTDEFTKGSKYRVAITCGLLVEGYDNEAITLCVILRHLNSQLFFNQFIGRCMQLMKFDKGPKDATTGTVLSYPKYNQKKMYDERDSFAVVAPAETKIDEATVNVHYQPLLSTLSHHKQNCGKKRSLASTRKNFKRCHQR